MIHVIFTGTQHLHKEQRDDAVIKYSTQVVLMCSTTVVITYTLGHTEGTKYQSLYISIMRNQPIGSLLWRRELSDADRR